MFTWAFMDLANTEMSSTYAGNVNAQPHVIKMLGLGN